MPLSAPVDPHPPTQRAGGLTGSHVSDLLAQGSLTSAGLVAELEERRQAIDAPGTPTELRSILAPHPAALDEARGRDVQRASGGGLGPLHGIPVLIKDNIEAVGLPGTAGSLALAGRPVLKDAPLVARLRAAGAVVLGSTNLSEWANLRSPRSASGWSAVGGLTANPWDLDRSAGGSSSGSGAAVAAGLAPLAVGTETNGSITCPAALNGVVGIKPTVGSVPGAGIVPVSVTQDVAGPLARTVRDAALLLEVLADTPGLVEASTDGRCAALRVGIADAWFTADDAVDGLARSALAALAGQVADVTPVACPDAGEDVWADQLTALLGDLVDDLDAYLGGRPGEGVGSLADVIAFNERTPVELAYFGQEFFDAALASGGRRAPEHRAARARNVGWAQAAGSPLLEGTVDALAAPAYRVAWPSGLGTGEEAAGGGAVCMAPSILGWPIVTVPIGLVDGLPVGLSFVGRAGSEPALIALAAAVERALSLDLRPGWRPRSAG